MAVKGGWQHFMPPLSWKLCKRACTWMMWMQLWRPWTTWIWLPSSQWRRWHGQKLAWEWEAEGDINEKLYDLLTEAFGGRGLDGNPHTALKLIVLASCPLTSHWYFRAAHSWCQNLLSGFALLQMSC
jgi:hypothetical protein